MKEPQPSDETGPVFDCFRGTLAFGELSRLEAKASNESSYTPAQSDKDCKPLEGSNGPGVSGWEGRDICLAIGLGRSRFMFALAS